MITFKGIRRGFAGARPASRGLPGYVDLQRAVKDRRFIRWPRAFDMDVALE
jgi:hypothetical protein